MQFQADSVWRTAFFHMPADRLIGFLTQIVLDFAGILPGRVLVDAQSDQVFRQKLMALIDAGGDIPGRNW
jgi:hypothetical protein